MTLLPMDVVKWTSAVERRRASVGIYCFCDDPARRGFCSLLSSPPLSFPHVFRSVVVVISLSLSLSLSSLSLLSLPLIPLSLARTPCLRARARALSLTIFAWHLRPSPGATSGLRSFDGWVSPSLTCEIETHDLPLLFPLPTYPGYPLHPDARFYA